MRFMISGRATNRHGSPIVRDGVVGELHRLGQQAVTSAPRRHGGPGVDFLVATDESITRRVSKVRWAIDHYVPVITYREMWAMIGDGSTPVAPMPMRAAERNDRLRAQGSEHGRVERAARAYRTPPPIPAGSHRITVADVQEVMEANERQGRRDAEALSERAAIQARESARAPDTPPPKPAAPAAPPRRRIVTRR